MKNKVDDSISKDILDDEIKNLSIEEIDKEMDDFYIDKEKIDNIKPPEEMKDWVKEAIDRAEKDMKKEKIRKYIIRGAASIAVIFTIGVYNPALAHYVPSIQKALENINNKLNIDEIASYTGIDKVLLKATVDENNKIKFIKPVEYKIEEDSSLNEEPEEQGDINPAAVGTQARVPTDFEQAKQLIHSMANSIIKPIDDRKKGELEINKENIQIAIDGLKYIPDEDARNYLYNELIRWSNGDMENAVLVHNYVWNMQDGSVGKAIAIDRDKLEQTINKNFK